VVSTGAAQLTAPGDCRPPAGFGASAGATRRMRNPWLDIPSADYIAHMSSPEVDQLSVLSRLVCDALDRFRPRDFLLLGCSTGNGLEHVDPAVTREVTGVDINPEYLRQLAERFPNPGFQLTLRAQDLADCGLPDDAFDLVHGALLFEYLAWPELLPRLARTLRSGGGLSVVLQRRSAALPAVTPTRFMSLRTLEPLFHFVDPERVVAQARHLRLEVQKQWTEELKSGKAFSVLHFRKVGRSGT
jgi:SAM-dependent methyltransferase